MIKIIYQTKNFQIFITRRDFIVRRKDNLYNHAHFTLLNEAIRFVKLIENKKLPYSDYWKHQAERLLTIEEYNTLISYV